METLCLQILFAKKQRNRPRRTKAEAVPPKKANIGEMPEQYCKYFLSLKL
jgi:hypothetical protein